MQHLICTPFYRINDVGQHENGLNSKIVTRKRVWRRLVPSSETLRPQLEYESDRQRTSDRKTCSAEQMIQSSLQRLTAWATSWLIIGLSFTIGDTNGQEPTYAPAIARASTEGETAIKTFQIPDGVEATLFAAEPRVANPVSFTIDQQGRLFVCETFRQQKGVEDNRSHMDWLEDDLAAQTVEDRLAYFKKHLGEKIVDYQKEHDRIRMIEDRDGDGAADHDTVFADRFNGILDGTGSSVLMREGNLYYTCIPKLWRLRDTDADGIADEREALHHGYGVRVAFRGHDSHGLIMGPDGRLYFSIGDRGYNIRTKEGNRLAKPYTGAVFRCDLDGSNLEVFATGLRNPQELAFDNYGNLFTCDNNSDGGDQARIVYVTRGSDSGWRMYYQYLADRGPWNREQLWHPQHVGQAAYITPPLLNFADGPSGFAHYPGVGLSPRYDDHFFLCDFRGAAGQSGIRSFALRSSGASYEVVDEHQFIWSILGTDCEFGFDGKLYVSDWVHGWDGLNKGRIYAFENKRYSKHEAVQQTQALMASGYRQISEDDLVGLLSHLDRRVRLEAQFELVRRGAVDALEVAARSADAGKIARIHAIWGIGQLSRKTTESLGNLIPLLEDPDPEIGAQAAKTLAEGYSADAEASLLGCLDGPPRLSLYAAQTLADYGAEVKDKQKAGEMLAKCLQQNGDQPVLRHMYSYALSRIFDDLQPLTLAGHNKHTRTGIVLALRRQQSPRVAKLLSVQGTPASDSVNLEIARAIHDEPIAEAMPALASLNTSHLANGEYRERAHLTNPLVRRVINANFIVGSGDCAERVAAIAANKEFASILRLEAIWALKNWNAPPKLDRVLGAYRPIERGNVIDMAPIVQPRLETLLTGAPAVQRAAIGLAGDVGGTGAAAALYRLANDQAADGAVRASAIAALETLDDERLDGNC